MQTWTAGRSILDGIGLAVAASAVGLFGLPLVFGSLPASGQAMLWLVVAVLDCVCLLLSTRAFENALANLVLRLPGRGRRSAPTSNHTTLEIARLSVAAAYLVLVQAILRHPLVAVVGAGAEPLLVEALFGILALLVLLVLLGWIYRAARPLVENVAWVALDATFATSVSEEAAKAASAITQPVAPTHTAEPAATS